MTRHKLLWLTCCSLAFVANADAQVGKDTGLWDWTQDSNHHQAIVKIDAGDGSGTGVVIGVDKTKPNKGGYEGYCLTAWHVVKDIHDSSIKIQFSNGRKAKGCRVIQTDEDTDIALIWAWIPAEIEPAKLAKNPIQGGDKIEFAGLGGGSELNSSLRHFKAVASSPSSMKKIFADVPLLPGDSGGPVFNEQHEVVGVISGGWFWWDGGVKMPNGHQIQATWPARASNIDPIRVLVADLDDDTKKF